MTADKNLAAAQIVAASVAALIDAFGMLVQDLSEHDPESNLSYLVADFCRVADRLRLTVAETLK